MERSENPHVKGHFAETRLVNAKPLVGPTVEWCIFISSKGRGDPVYLRGKLQFVGRHYRPRAYQATSMEYLPGPDGINSIAVIKLPVNNLLLPH